MIVLQSIVGYASACICCGLHLVLLELGFGFQGTDGQRFAEECSTGVHYVQCTSQQRGKTGRDPVDKAGKILKARLFVCELEVSCPQQIQARSLVEAKELTNA